MGKEEPKGTRGVEFAFIDVERWVEDPASVTYIHPLVVVSLLVPNFTRISEVSEKRPAFLRTLLRTGALARSWNACFSCRRDRN